MSAPLRTVLLALAATLAAATAADAQVGTYTSCERAGDATIVEVSGATCDDARAAAAAIAGTPATNVEAALAATGWSALRAYPTPGSRAYEVVATRGLAALKLRRPGDAPDLDGWTPGRELLLSRHTLVGGAKPPSDAVLCTTAFLVRLGSHVGGLSAAHCAGVSRKTGTSARRNAALRRPPQPGIVLGGVRRNLALRSKPIDALVLPVPSGPDRPSADVIYRLDYQPPWFVVGGARPLLGREVCFSGRSSGADNCGQIVHPFPGVHGLVCTDITARPGDSGSPVYTRPTAAGTVRAVGIANIVFGLFQSMCFVPLQPVLDALHGQLVSAGR